VTELLTERGIPRGEIAAIGEADSDAKKQALFERVRQGTVRVLLGSTTKMGTGMNVQRRLVALHHLDAPWKPAEVEQREGRILRQGNENAEVGIFRYVTGGSFDAFMWQALETKQNFISQVITGESAVRRAEDIGGEALSYAEVKAIASGNPAVLTLAEADCELQRLAILKKNHADEQYLARRQVRELPETITRLTRRASDLAQDLGTLRTHAGDPITLDGHGSAEEKALARVLNGIPDKVQRTSRVPLGTFQGLRFGLIIHPGSSREVFLEGATTRETQLARDSQGPRATLNALDRLAGSYETQLQAVRKELQIAEGQLRDYQARLGLTFAHDAYLAELAGLRDELRAALSENRKESVAPAAEIAERIQKLKSGQAIDPAPERMKRREHAAEAPVTTRIRERTSSQPPDPETGHLSPAESPAPEPITRFVFVKLNLSDFSLPILPRIEATRRQVAKLTTRRPVVRSLQPGRQLDLF
jgi:hypothetical protein